MSTETTKKKIKIDNGTEFARVYTDKEVDSKISAISELPKITLNQAEDGSFTCDLTNIEEGVYTISQKSTDGSIINYSGIGTIFKLQVGENLYKKSLGGYMSAFGSFLSFGNTFDNNNKFSTSDFVQRAATISSSSITYFDDDFKLATIKHPIENNLFLTYDSDTYSYKWVAPSTGKSINLFGNHSILVPNASTDTNIDLYNHFIKITGNASEVESGTNIIARFTIQSSNNVIVDTPEKLATLLGNEFELGCNGIYGNYNIIGLKKTADGALNIIYNNSGAENLLSTTGITLTITDTVKNI